LREERGRGNEKQEEYCQGRGLKLVAGTAKKHSQLLDE
jgi:hypothetical protein